MEPLSSSARYSKLGKWFTDAANPGGEYIPKDPKLAARMLEERAKNFKSIVRFGKEAFPRWFDIKPSGFHRHLDRTARDMLTGAGGSTRAEAAPRGNGKSTFVSKLAQIWNVAHQKECMAISGRRVNCVVLASWSLTLPRTFIADIRRELEDNDYLQTYYPEIMGEGQPWTQDRIRSKNGVWIISGSTGSSIRGLLPEGQRPNWIVIDDAESMENAQTLEQRNKCEDWLDKDVKFSGDIRYPPDIWMLGTIVHRNSVLSRKISDWGGRTFQSVISWSKHPEMWEQWRHLYLDTEGELGHSRSCAGKLWKLTHKRLIAAVERGDDPEEATEYLFEWWAKAFKKAVGELPKREQHLREAYQAALIFVETYLDDLPDHFKEVSDQWEGTLLETIRKINGRKSKAFEFYKKHRKKMLLGTRVLWPDGEDYYRLMCLKADASNENVFWQEKQNVSRRAEEEIFGADAWTFYRVPADLPAHPSPRQIKRLFPEGTMFIGSLDPSLGKESKKHDYAAITILARLPNTPEMEAQDLAGVWRIAYSWIKRDIPSKMFAKMMEIDQVFRCKSWAVEAVQFQEFFASLILKASRKMGHPLAVHEVKHPPGAGKGMRIKSIEPHVSAGNLQYPAIYTDDPIPIPMPIFHTLWEQFQFFGERDVHDDGPDSVEMAWTEGMDLSSGPPVYGKAVFHEGRREMTAEEKILDRTPGPDDPEPLDSKRKGDREPPPITPQDAIIQAVIDNLDDY